MLAGSAGRSLDTSQNGQTWTGPIPLPDRARDIIRAGGQYLTVATTSDDVRQRTGEPVTAALRIGELLAFAGLMST